MVWRGRNRRRALHCQVLVTGDEAMTHPLMLPPPNPPVQLIEADTVRKFAVRYQRDPNTTQTLGEPTEELNAAVFLRNRLFATDRRIGRTWIDVLSGDSILRRWGAIMKRDWAVQLS